MTKNTEIASFQLPAGTYLITDPCYVFGADSWDQVLQDTNYFYAPGAHTFKGHAYCGVSTLYGDGSYNDGKGNTYSVDAGLIGAVAVDLVLAENKITAAELALLKVVTFHKPVDCGRYSDGTIYIGNIEIPAGYDEESDEYDEESDEYDESGYLS